MPYRTPPDRRRSEVVDDAAANDDHLLGILLLLIGGVRVATAVVRHEVFEAEATIALLMIAVAVGLLLRRA